MQLNVYLISHPIFKILSGNEEQKNNYQKKYIGLFLIYEILRKEINILTIYIRKINKYNNFYKISKSQEYYIITNLNNTASIIGEIELCIPQVNIIHINNVNKNTLTDMLKITPHNLNKNRKFIIFDTTLNLNYITKITQFLVNEVHININNIVIGTFFCNNSILNHIGQEYPQLSVYTTKIIV